jgi:hypothetical protein
MNIGLARLTNQRITSRPFAQPSQVVAWLGAMQAQDYTGVLWSIGLRMSEATEQSVEQALAERSFVRTWPMRGTLHFVAAADVRWMLALLTPRMVAQTASRYRQLELDEATFARSKELFVTLLQGGKQLTRDELYQHLEQANITPTGQRGYHLLGRAAQDALICFGAPRGKEQTFTLLDEWIPPTKSLTREEALSELARRYVTSHGPVTLQDLVRWAGITVAEAKAGLAMVGGELIQETIDGQGYWLPYTSPEATANTTAAHLLPGFDEYLLGYGDRSAVLDPAYANLICPGGNGVFRPTLVINGQVVGTWKRLLKKGKVVITPNPFTSFADAERAALVTAAERYTTFLGLQLAW